jgi:AcrR family transcriptional regulator
MSLRARQIAETRAALIDAGKRLFAQNGYAATAAQDIVEAAELTRGALYHHFPGGKEELFEAIHRQLQHEAMAAVIAADENRGTDGDAGLSAYFDAATRPDYRQIVLSDGPAVFGWEKWHLMESDYAMGLVADAVIELAADGQLDGLDQAMLSHILFGAIGEAAMVIASADDPAAAKAKALAIFYAMFR